MYSPQEQKLFLLIWDTSALDPFRYVQTWFDADI